VRPIARAPRTRWRVSLGPGGETSQAWLIASELGVVCGVADGSRVLVLDPDSGDVRWSMARVWAPGWRVPFQGCGVVVDGERLVVTHGSRVEVRDLWSGEVQGRASAHPEPPRGRLGEAPGSLHVATDGELLVLAGAGQLSAWPLDPRGDAGPRWRVPSRAPASWLTRGELLWPGPDRTQRVSRTDGRALGVVEGQVAAGDGRGVVLHHDEHMVLCDASLAPVWRADDETVVSLGPVVITYRARHGLCARDRASGAVLGAISVRTHVDPVVARDVVLGVGAMRDQEPAPANSPIVAQRADGAPLWSLVHEPAWTRVIALAPLTDRVYALSDDGSLGCYEA
jgi:hypothetical protein